MRFLRRTVIVLMLSMGLFAQWRADREAQVVAGREGDAYSNPVWSPVDSNLIAMTKPGYRGIWLLNLQNGQIRQLIDEIGAGFGFSWSHNGKYIATRITRYDRLKPFNEIIVIDVQSGELRTITAEKVRLRDVPRWSNDDALIYAFSKRELLTFPLDFVTPDSTASKNGWLVYNANGKIGVSQRDGGNILQHERLDPLSGKRYINLTPSPDGRKVAFEVMGGHLYVMDLATQDVVDLGEGYRPAWSPDGHYIVYMITEDDGHRFTASDIYIIKNDGSEKVNITNTAERIELNPSWSSDGKKIAFDDYETGEILILPIRNTASQSEEKVQTDN